MASENVSRDALERVANFREISGYAAAGGRRVAGGRLYRSGHWGHASDEDVAFMASIGVGLVVDFRSDLDIASDGADRLPDGVASFHLPMSDPAAGPDIREIMQESGPDALVEHFGNGKAERMMERSAAGLVTQKCDEYGAFLAKLSEFDSAGVLFHCSAGKDRAGWAASTLLLALGVAEEDIVAEYLKSNAAREQLVQRSGPQTMEWRGSVIEPLLAVKLEYIAASFAAVRSEFGDVDGYLREGLGFGDDRRARLQSLWLA